MFRPFLALAAVAAVAVPVVAAPAGAADNSLRVYVSNCKTQVYKPKSITVYCADSGVVISKIKYSRYNATTAVGSGTSTVNLCDPNCAAGNTKTYKVKFTLSRVTQCGDSYQFRRLRMSYVGAKPKGSRTVTQSFSCADAPTR
jgi:type 1 fimbria pilin